MTKLKPAIVKRSDLKLGETIETKTVSEIKLKNFPPDRSMVTIDCMEQFGFLPQYIVVAKTPGRNNTINISAMRKVMLDLKKAADAKLGGKKSGKTSA